MPSALSEKSVVNNGYIYTVGGYTGIVYTSTVQYAPINSTGSIGVWSNTTPLPSARFGNPLINNGYIYTLGGTDTSNTATSAVLYAPINSTGSIGAWSNTTPLPSGVASHAVLLNNEFVYTVGGLDANSNVTSTVFYAPVSTSTGAVGAWATTKPLPSALYDHYAVVNNGYIYTVGGQDVNFKITSTVIYAPINSTGSIGAWARTTPLPSALYDHYAVVNNGYIYTVGGLDTNSKATSTVFYAPINSTGSVGAWSSTTPLPSSLYNHSAVVNNGYIYAVGGQDVNANFTSTVFFAQFQ